MTSRMLEAQIAEERAHAVRHLLARPLRTREDDHEIFALIASHRAWLTDYFERTCGWPLMVDVTAGTVRLVKRTHAEDPSRPARRRDGEAFDRRRYALLFSCAAELVSRPLTTIAELSDALELAHSADDLVDYDSGNVRHRGAFIDVLRWLIEHGMLTETAGQVDDYQRAGEDAVLSADVTRVALLTSAATPPSRIPPQPTADVLRMLTDEPRYRAAAGHSRMDGSDDDADYGDADDGMADTATVDQRNRWGRHQVFRRLLDDPVLDVAALDPYGRAYLDSPTGRRLVVEGIEAAGMLLERHADAMLAIDPDRIATDITFVDSAAHVVQAAGVLLAAVAAGEISDIDSATTVVEDLLAADQGWAKRYQEGGAGALARAALDHLKAFGVITVAGNAIMLRSAGRRYRVAVDDRRAGSGITGNNSGDIRDHDTAQGRASDADRAGAQTSLLGEGSWT